MNRFRWSALLIILCLSSLALHGQNLPGYGWSSFGVLPFRGYDFVIVKAPARYILYYQRHSTTTLAESNLDHWAALSPLT